MAWIESHQTLRNHPKLARLCDKTGWSRAEAIGRLHMLWWWCLDYAETGDLTRLSVDSPRTVQDAMEVDLEPRELLKILVETGWIDQKNDKIIIHDWMLFAGNLYRDRERKRLERKKLRNKFVRGQSVELPRTVRGTSALPTVPNQPNQQDLKTLPFSHGSKRARNRKSTAKPVTEILPEILPEISANTNHENHQGEKPMSRVPMTKHEEFVFLVGREVSHIGNIPEVLKVVERYITEHDVDVTGDAQPVIDAILIEHPRP